MENNNSADMDPVCVTCGQLQVLRGMEGTPGRDGREGRNGTMGDKGEPGVRGGRGEQGESGQGPQGAKGDRGSVGFTAQKGQKGSQGYTGQKGSIGSQGYIGQNGQNGSQGYTGSRGYTGQKGQKGEGSGSGVTYTRWGRTSCPSISGTQLVYSGKVGATKDSHTGGGSNQLCMPNNPEYLSYGPGNNGGVDLYGAEYAAFSGQPLRHVDTNDIPCAVCYASTRGSQLMIPAKTTCPTGWTEEYDGYLTAANNISRGRILFICIDRSPQSCPGEDDDDGDRSDLYMVEAVCDEGFSCPPYSAGKEIACVVCTR